MTTTTFSHVRFNGRDRLAPSLGEMLRAFVARLSQRAPVAADTLDSPLAGRRWCDSTERELLAGLGRRRSILD